MEALKEKYGFNEGQINDIKQVVADSITMILPDIITDISPFIIENYNTKMKSGKEQLDDINRTEREALVYSQNNMD